MRIFFSSKLKKEELILQFENYIRELSKELKIYEPIEKRLSEKIIGENCEDDVIYHRFTVKRGLSFDRAEINWAKECIEDLKKLL